MGAQEGQSERIFDFVRCSEIKSQIDPNLSTTETPREKTKNVTTLL